MPFYRIEIGDRRSGHAHVNFGRSKNTPSACIAPALDYDDITIFVGRCARMAAALCDAPAGEDLAGKKLTCSAPICEHHRVRGGRDIDYCPRHAHLAPAALPLEETPSTPAMPAIDELLRRMKGAKETDGTR